MLKAGSHLALVTDAWLPQTNGVVRTLTRTCAELEAMGYRVSPISPDQFKTVACPTYPEIRLAMGAFGTVGKKLAALNPDAIHIATEGPLGWAARRWCLKNKVPYTTAYHTRFPEYVHARCRLPLAASYAVMRFFHKHSAAVMTPSQGIVDALTARGFKNARLWSRGVELDKFNPAGPVADFSGYRKPVAICTGRVAVEKNLPAFLSMPWPGTKVVVGDGPARDALQKAFPDAVFTGRLSDEDMVAHLRAADVFVFPSLTETFGNVVLEALACGTPVAAYPVVGPADTIGGAPHKVGALDTDLAQAAGSALTATRTDCRTYAETFTWPAATRTFLNYLAPLNPQAKAAA